MTTVIDQFERAQQKQQTPHVRSGDTVRVHQRITEGSKVRTQAFEGVVIRTRRMNSLTAAVTLRRISSGVGVEKTFKLHAPNVEKVDVLRRSKVRRNFLSFLRQRQGKAARLQEVAFDRSAAEVDETVSLVEEAEEDAPTTPSEEEEQVSPETDKATEDVGADQQDTAGDDHTESAVEDKNA